MRVGTAAQIVDEKERGNHDENLAQIYTDEKAARKLLEDVRNLIGETTSESEVCTGKIHRFLDEFRRQN